MTQTTRSPNVTKNGISSIPAASITPLPIESSSPKIDKQKKNGENNFAETVHAMVSYASKHKPGVVNWIQNGEAFTVCSTHKDLGLLLTNFFRHRKYSSFQRQLNMYGFKKFVKGKYRGAFHHPNFHRDNISSSELDRIKRRPPPKRSTTPLSTKSNPKLYNRRKFKRKSQSSNESCSKKSKTNQAKLVTAKVAIDNERPSDLGVSITEKCGQADACNHKLFQSREDTTTDTIDYFSKENLEFKCDDKDILFDNLSNNVGRGGKNLENLSLLHAKSPSDYDIMESILGNEVCVQEADDSSTSGQDNASSDDGDTLRIFNHIFGARVGLDDTGRLHVDYTPSKKHAFYMSPIVCPPSLRMNSLDSFNEFSKTCIDPFDRVFADVSDNKNCDFSTVDKSMKTYEV